MDRVPEGNTNDLKGDYFYLDQGTNKFRILSSCIAGYETWILQDDGKKKPIRSKTKLPEDTQNVSISKFGQKQLNKYFMAFIIWDYNEEKIKLFQLDKRNAVQDLKIIWLIKKKLKRINLKNYKLLKNRFGEGKAKD